MCNSCGDISKLHEEILKPNKGEQFSINAKNLTDYDVKQINNFISFVRNVTELKKLIIKFVI